MTQDTDLRDQIAMRAMVQLIHGKLDSKDEKGHLVRLPNTWINIADAAYALADAMLSARAQQEENGHDAFMREQNRRLRNDERSIERDLERDLASLDPLPLAINQIMEYQIKFIDGKLRDHEMSDLISQSRAAIRLQKQNAELRDALDFYIADILSRTESILDKLLPLVEKDKSTILWGAIEHLLDDIKRLRTNAPKPS